MTDRMPQPYICPTCGYQVDKFKALPWGDGEQETQIAPFLCAGCGEASIINLVTMRVESVPAIGWELVKEKNPKLWAEIEKTQRKIREYRKTRGATS